MLLVSPVMAEAVGMACAAVSLVGFCGERRSLDPGFCVQPSKAMVISMVCGWRSLEASLSGQAPLQDATAPPPPTVHPHSYKMAPKSITFKSRHKKRSSGSGGGGDGFDGDDGRGGFYGGGWCGNGNGGDGGGEWDFWGEDWEEEGTWQHRRYREAGKTLALLYQAACWMSLTHTLHYAAKRIVDVFQRGCGDDSPSGDPVAFAHCSSAFLQRDVALLFSENLQLSINRR